MIKLTRVKNTSALNEFLTPDRKIARRKIVSAEFLMQELLPEEIADNNFEECISLCESAIQMFRDLKRMHHPVEVVQMHELASQFLQKGINVNVIRVPDHES